jgi:hypothetical protein
LYNCQITFRDTHLLPYRCCSFVPLLLWMCLLLIFKLPEFKMNYIFLVNDGHEYSLQFNMWIFFLSFAVTVHCRIVVDPSLCSRLSFVPFICMSFNITVEYRLSKLLSLQAECTCNVNVSCLFVQYHQSRFEVGLCIDVSLYPFSFASLVLSSGGSPWTCIFPSYCFTGLWIMSGCACRSWSTVWPQFHLSTILHPYSYVRQKYDTSSVGCSWSVAYNATYM